MRSPSTPIRWWVPGLCLVLLGVLALQAGPASVAAADDLGNVTLYRASNATFDDAGDVESAIASGAVEPADELIVGEAVVVAIDSDRLASSMAAGNGSTTERFLDALDGDAAFRVAQTNPPPQRPRKIAPVGRENVTAYRDGTTVYALVDTGALGFRYDGEGDPAELHDGDRFVVAVGYGLDEHDPSGPAVTLYHARAAFFGVSDDEPLPPEVVNRSVEVNVAPEQALVARLTFEDGRTVTTPVEPVDWSGNPGVSFDLRDVEPGTEYTLELVHDGTVVERHSGTVLEPRGRVTNATLTEVVTQHVVTRSGERVTVEIDDHLAVDATVRLSHGGKVVVLNDDCEQVGSEWVAAGVETRVAIDLWNGGEPVRARNHSDYGVLVRLHRGNRAGQDRYAGPGAVATVGLDEGTCREKQATLTPTVTATTSTGEPSSSTMATPTASGTDGPTGTDATERPDGRTTTTGQPGFTAALALTALLGLLFVHRRRS